MSHDDIIPSGGQLVRHGFRSVPSLFVDETGETWAKVIEFFTARIRNLNTRLAYARAVVRFSHWCEERKLRLDQVQPVVVAWYIEELGSVASRPTVKQHLAALRMLFDYLVVQQVVSVNPAAPVRGPKHVVKRGTTPVLTADEARQLIDAIDCETIGGLRDRALIGVMVYSFARVGAVVAMNVEDYFQHGTREWFRLREKGGKLHDLPAHHKAQEYMDLYIAAAGIGDQKHEPLFRTMDRNRILTSDRMDRREVLAMIKRRARQAQFGDEICCHTFRATGITTYLLNGGTLEKAQQIANHESPRTTKLYDRTNDEVTLDEIERILI